MSESQAIVFTIEEGKTFQEEGTFEMPFNLKLEKPVKLGEELKEFITLRNEPTIQDLEDLPIMDQKMKHFKIPVSKVTGETMVFVNKLGFKDFNNVLSLLQPFMS